jgi:hypothetical protein
MRTSVLSGARGVSSPIPINNQTPYGLDSYKLELVFLNGKIYHLNIKDYADIESMLKIILEIDRTNPFQFQDLAFIKFDRLVSNSKINEIISSFERSEYAESLLFIADFNNRIIIQHNPIEEDIGDGRSRFVYGNGTTEEFILGKIGYSGTRIFPDGAKEQGIFDSEKRFLRSGYRITDGVVSFVNPTPLTSYQKNTQIGSYLIVELEGALVVLDEWYEKSSICRHSIVDIPVKNILLKVCEMAPYGCGSSIKNVLCHRGFEEHRQKFIEEALSPSENGAPKLFGFSSEAIIDILEEGHKLGLIHPLSLVVPTTKENIFILSAKNGFCDVLTKLIELFPDDFKVIGRDVIESFLLGGYSSRGAIQIAEKFEGLGGRLEPYHDLWFQVACQTRPDDSFKRKFSLLDSSKQSILYDAAYVYCNSFIYEPSDVAVKADEYSLNFMWVNEKKMSEDQDFLLGDGDTPIKRKIDFERRFVDPISIWAKENPGSPINIWFDGEMINSGAIDRSYSALRSVLDPTSYRKINFRDVRSVEVVRSLPKVFSEEVSVYFRVDLLRAIVADYTLSEKETKYFVYGDLDVKPVSRQALFDKRTVNFLNEYGFVLAKNNKIGFENCFQIINGENQQLMDSHRKVIISLNIEMAIQKPRSIQEQQVYDTYFAMMAHFLDNDGRYEPVDFSLQGDKREGKDSLLERYERFRHDRFRPFDVDGVCFTKQKIKVRKIMPTKPVRVPPSHFAG